MSNSPRHEIICLFQFRLCKAMRYFTISQCGGVRWPSGRASSSGVRGRRFETYLRRVVFLSKTFKSPKVLVMLRKRWFRPEMTETVLTWTLSLNTNKQTFSTCTVLFNDLYSTFSGNSLAILVSCRVLVSILIVITLYHDRDSREAKFASYINRAQLIVMNVL